MKKITLTLFFIYIFMIFSHSDDFVNKISRLKFNKEEVIYRELQLDGYVSFWYKNKNDVIPSVIEKNIPVKLELKVPQNPGYVERKLKIIKSTQTFNITAKIEFYSICEPKDKNCQNTYFSAQIKTEGDINIICSAYYNEKDFTPFPAMACGQFIKDKSVGLSLHRKKY